jgi:hypothetical protein
MHGPDTRVDGPRAVRGQWFGLALVVVMVSSLVATVAGHAQAPGATARAASVCADFATQADAQRAADTRDADSDGVYCESLPCPCSTGGEGSTSPAPTPAPSPAPNSGCIRPTQVQRIGFSKTRYRHIRRHYLATLAKGWPQILVLNRPEAAERRERLLEGHPDP